MNDRWIWFGVISINEQIHNMNILQLFNAFDWTELGINEPLYAANYYTWGIIKQYLWKCTRNNIVPCWCVWYDSSVWYSDILSTGCLWSDTAPCQCKLGKSRVRSTNSNLHCHRRHSQLLAARRRVKTVTYWALLCQCHHGARIYEEKEKVW